MTLSEREWRTLRLIERLQRAEVSVSEVAASLDKSVRQVQRLRKAVAQEGPTAVVHGNRGRPSKQRLSAELRMRIVMLRRDKYRGFNDHHFTEKLVEVEGIAVSRETVRRLLRAQGLGSPRKRRAPRHRHRRERKAQAGQMVLWDGSRHDWLEGRGPRLCLMGAIDDATGELLPGAHFTENETTVGYLRVLRDMLADKGIPHTVYGDRHSSLKRNDSNWTLEEELAGQRQKTQVGQALDELGIQALFALSAQAKGRIERLWGVLQDRLVSELRLAGATSQGQANQVLRRYRKEHNARFQIPAADVQSAWRPAPKDRTDLLDLCALRYVRKVYQNNTIRLAGQVLDIPRRRGARLPTYAGRIVQVRVHLNGHVRVFFEDECIAWKQGGPRPTGSTLHGPRTESAWRTIKRRNEARRQPRDEDEGDIFT